MFGQRIIDVIDGNGDARCITGGEYHTHNKLTAGLCFSAHVTDRSRRADSCRIPLQCHYSNSCFLLTKTGWYPISPEGIQIRIHDLIIISEEEE